MKEMNVGLERILSIFFMKHVLPTCRGAGNEGMKCPFLWIFTPFQKISSAPALHYPQVRLTYTQYFAQAKVCHASYTYFIYHTVLTADTVFKFNILNQYLKILNNELLFIYIRRFKLALRVLSHCNFLYEHSYSFPDSDQACALRRCQRRTVRSRGNLNFHLNRA